MSPWVKSPQGGKIFGLAYKDKMTYQYVNKSIWFLYLSMLPALMKDSEWQVP